MKEDQPLTFAALQLVLVVAQTPVKVVEQVVLKPYISQILKGMNSVVEMCDVRWFSSSKAVGSLVQRASELDHFTAFSRKVLHCTATVIKAALCNICC